MEMAHHRLHTLTAGDDRMGGINTGLGKQHGQKGQQTSVELKVSNIWDLFNTEKLVFQFFHVNTNRIRMRKFLAAIDCHGLTNQHGDFWTATWDGSMSWRFFEQQHGQLAMTNAIIIDVVSVVPGEKNCGPGPGYVIKPMKYYEMSWTFLERPVTSRLVDRRRQHHAIHIGLEWLENIRCCRCCPLHLKRNPSVKSGETSMAELNSSRIRQNQFVSLTNLNGTHDFKQVSVRLPL